MNRSRVTGDLASHGNIFVDIANDRVGIGSTIPGQKLSLPDSAKIALGNSADLQIFHDGTHSRINAVNTGFLAISSGADALTLSASNRIDISDDFIRLRSRDGSDVYMTGTVNSSVDLYHNGSKKFETRAGGATVSGTINATGGAFTGNLTFTNNVGVLFGSGNPFQIYHNSGTSIIEHHGTGQIHIKPKATEHGIKIFPDGAVELYHDNSKRFETTSVGAKVTHSGAATRLVVGSTDASGAWLVLDGDSNGDGAGSDYAYIEHNASGHLNLINPVGTVSLQGGGVNSVVCQEDAEVVIYHNGNRKFETQTTGAKVTGILDVTGNITGSGDLTLTDTTADSAAGPELKLYRNSASPADADYLGQIKFAGESDTGVERNYAKITGKILDASNGTEDGIIEFAHIKAGSQTITGRFRSDSLQLLNGTSLTVAGTSDFTGDITATGDINANDHINLASGKKLSMASDVFKIYHSTNAAIINESGDLLITQNVSNKDIKISTGSGPAEIVRITSDGNVNIGGEFDQSSFKTSIYESTSNAGLVVKGGSANHQTANIWCYNNANHWLALGVWGSTASTSGLITASDGLVGCNSGDLCLYSTLANGNVKFGAGSGYPELMRLTSGGNLMLGTSTAAITAGIGMMIANSGGARIKLCDSDLGVSSSDGFEIIAAGDGTAYIWNRENTNLRIATNNTERLRIDSSGRFIFRGDSTGGTSGLGGFGTHTWTPKVQVLHDQGQVIIRDGDEVWGGALHLAKCRGTYASPTAAAQNDRAGGLYYHAHDGTDFLNYVAGIESYLDNGVGSNDTPGRLVFSTAADGANSLTERLRIKSNGSSKFSRTASGTDAGTVLVNTDYSNYGVVCVRDKNATHDACLQAENENTGNNEYNRVYRSVNRNSTEWANAALCAKSHVFRINSGSSSGDKFFIQSDGARCNVTPNNNVCNVFRANTGFLNYGVFTARDTSSTNVHNAGFQVENPSTGSDTTNQFMRSVDLNSANWANAKYSAKAHRFLISGSADTTKEHRITSDCNLITGRNDGNFTYNDTSAANNTYLELYGGTVAGNRGILSLSGRTGSNNGMLGTIWFVNGNNSGTSPGANMRLAAALQAHSYTTNSNSSGNSGASLSFYTKTQGGSLTERFQISHDGHLIPNGNNNYDLGSSSEGWRNLYVNDAHFSNKGGSNSVDGTWGDWTLQEGENDIFMINNRTGKKFAITMREVS